jgi:hypothetical protein
MVKGISKQVIVVRAPDPRFFEQAIFIVKDDALGRQGVTEEQIIKEARRVADGYVQTHTGLSRPAAFYGLAGALCVALVWLASALLF